MAQIDELAFTSAIDQAELIRRREVSPVELTEMYLRRIDELNPRLGAFVTVAADHALAAARDAEARDAEERGTDAHPGPAHPSEQPFRGVPISIKDLSDTAGIRTTHGCAAWADRIPTADDDHVRRIRDAGFVILGKTVTPELGPVNVSEPPGYPPGRNPWNPELSCGGSSGGAAAALAAGLCPISQGSDGGGSIRNPSAWCGTFGLKPSRGRISFSPRPNDFFSIVGPISRGVADAAALLDVMAGPAPGDLYWAPPPSRPFRDEVGVSPGPLRVAVSVDAEGVAVAPEYAAAATAAGELLASLGHHVVDATPPSVMGELLPKMQALFCGSYAGRELDGTLPPIDTLTPWSQTMIEMGRGIPAGAYASAIRAVHTASKRMAAFFADFDLLVTPTVAAPPPRVGQFANIDMSRVAELWALTPFTGMWNNTGQPAVSFPWGLDDNGLPIGVQMVGLPAGEAMLLRVAAQVEEAHPWAHLRPPMS